MNSTEPLIKLVLLLYGSEPIPDRKGWQSMKCPYHDDSTASASVNLDLDSFKCHGCAMKGDSVGLIMKQEGLDYTSSIEYIAAELGISDEEVRERRRVSSKVSKRKRNKRGSSRPLPPGSRQGPDKGP